MADYRICVICSGNICRSPMGEVILRHLLDEAGLGDSVEVDSAGTGGWHEGDGADPRTLTSLTSGGYDGSAHRARQWQHAWYADRDLVLVADRGHERALLRLAPSAEDRDKVRLFRSFDPESVAADDLEMDDPWWGDDRDFDRTYAEVRAAVPGVVDHVRERISD